MVDHFPAFASLLVSQWSDIIFTSVTVMSLLMASWGTLLISSVPLTDVEPSPELLPDDPRAQNSLT